MKLFDVSCLFTCLKSRKNWFGFFLEKPFLVVVETLVETQQEKKHLADIRSGPVFINHVAMHTRKVSLSLSSRKKEGERSRAAPAIADCQLHTTGLAHQTEQHWSDLVYVTTTLSSTACSAITQLLLPIRVNIYYKLRYLACVCHCCWLQAQLR